MTTRAALIVTEANSLGRDNARAPVFARGSDSTRVGIPENSSLNFGVEYLDSQQIHELRSQPGTVAVEWAMPMKIDLASETPGEEIMTVGGQPNSWGISAIGANIAPNAGEGVTVAILDSGADLEHASLQHLNDQPAECFRNFTVADDAENIRDVTDNLGHGTHCAGIIAGQDINGFRIGVAPGIAQLAIGKVVDGNQGTHAGIVMKAMKWAVEDIDAHVVSISMSFDLATRIEHIQNDFDISSGVAASMALSDAFTNYRIFEARIGMYNAIEQAGRHGTIIVAAAGNESNRTVDEFGGGGYSIPVMPPFNLPDIISVGSVRQVENNFAFANSSNSKGVLFAPGDSIRSAKANTPNELIEMSGTSMACPHVAGVAALWWSQALAGDIGVTASVVKTRLLAGAEPNTLAPSEFQYGLAKAPLI